jgi:hypothetical protein
MSFVVNVASVRRGLSIALLAVPLAAGLCADPIEAPFPEVDAPPVADPPPSMITVVLPTTMSSSASRQRDAETSRAIDVKVQMEQLWSTFDEPIEIVPSVWLVMRPTAAGVIPLRGEDRRLRAGAHVVARPHIVLGSKPSATATPLPSLTPAPDGHAFNLAVPIDVPYTEIEHQIDSLFQLSGEGLRFPAAGRFYVKPTAIQLYGYGTKAIVRLAFEGSATGVLYLVGTPSYDPIRNLLTIPDLDYSLETKNLLLKLTSWADGDQLRADLRTRLSLNVDRQVAAARALATSALNRTAGPLTMSGRVDDFRILGLFTQTDSGRFRLLTTASGSLNVAMREATNATHIDRREQQ